MSRNLTLPIFKHSLIAVAVFALISPISFAQEEKVNSNETIEELENFSQETSAIDLSKVVVTAGGFSQEVKSAPASISVVSKAELDNAPFRDVTDALKDVPGVVITGGGASQDISIRGMAPQYTLMMVDGKRQNSRQTRPNSDGSGIEQGWIPPLAAIDRIEVVRGPMSSRYGSDAMGGVINIITKKVADKWGGNVRTDYTVQHDSDAGNGSNTEFYLNGPLIKETLGLQLYGKYSNRQEDEFSGGNPEQRIENIGGKLSFVPVKGQTFELEYGSGFQKRFWTADKSADKSSDNKYKRNNGSLRYTGEFDGGIIADLLVSHEKNNNYSRNMIVKNTEVNGNVIIPIGTHTITVGGQYVDEKLNDNNNKFGSHINNIERKSFAIFIEDEWWILDNFALTAGLRYDHDENYGAHWSPRLYGVWNIDEAWTIKGGISTGYRTPSIRQAVADWGHGTGGGRTNGVILGNPNLKPEKSTNYEISVNFAPDENLDINTTVFYTQFKDKLQNIEICRSPGYTGKYDSSIHDKCIAPNGQKYYFIQTNQNIDDATLKGVELAARWRPVEEVTLSTSYTFTKTEQTSGANKGDPLNRIPKHLLNVSADWQFTPQANIWVKANYRGKETQLSRGGAKGTEYPSYTMVDIGGSYKFDDRTSFFAGVYNLTNKKITDEKYGKSLDGRRYWLGVSVDF